MPYTINITFKKPLTAVQNRISPISPVYGSFSKNYIADESYTEASGDTIWNTKMVKNEDVTTLRKTVESSKSVYATGAIDIGEYDSEIYAHSSITNPVPLAKFVKEVYPVATYDSGTDTYSATLTVEDGEEYYYLAIGESLGNQGVTVEAEHFDTISFKRYTTTSDDTVCNMIYIPTTKELKYFEDADNSAEVDPQPQTIESVTVDTTKGIVYQAVSIDTDNYIVKTDSIVIVYHKPVGIEDVEFTYDGNKFTSTSATPAKLPYGIKGRDSNGDWVCSEDSIMIDLTNDYVFIGNDIYIPSDSLPNGDSVYY